MKKIVLVGELGEIAIVINKALGEAFKVQLCTANVENVKAMVRIIKPDMILLCDIGKDDIHTEVFEWIHTEVPQIPVLGITTKGKWEQHKDYYTTDQFETMFRPVGKNQLYETCCRILKLEVEDHIEEAPPVTEDEKKKIMIVDDSALMLRTIKGMLDDRYTVFIATSGNQALRMIPQKKPDLILLDCSMPGLDGKQTFEAMKERGYAQNIPVVFLTAVGERKQIYSILKSKPASYILKPPEQNKLIETIEQVLKRDPE